ncbi:hypothetical protein LguiA_002371 [Lonicera macranthoides]
MKGGDQLDLPAGFRFHPTDEELVLHYLCRKCAAQSIAVPIIAEIDLYKFDPWQLPGMAMYGEKEWYFFSPRDRKYPNGSRPNRAAGTGYWKATGADKPVGKPKTLGIKKALVFYAGKAPKGIKTNWIMHEYRLANVDRSAGAGKKNNLRLDDWVLCRIYNKKGIIEKHYNVVDKTLDVPDMEEKKPEISTLGYNHVNFTKMQPPQQPPRVAQTVNHSDYNYNFQTSSSSEYSTQPPRLNGYSSSSSGQAELMFEKEAEVQSDPKWNNNDNDFDFELELSNYMDTFADDPFAPQTQYNDYQDLFLFNC